MFKNSKKPSFSFDAINLPRINLSFLRLAKNPLIIVVSLVALSLLYAFSKPTTIPVVKTKNIALQIPQVPLVNFIATTPEEDINWQEITIKSGQSLSSIFKDLKLSQTLLYNIIHLNEDSKSLTKLYPGSVLGFSLTEKGEFSQLKYNISESKELFVIQDLTSNSLSTQLIEHPTEINLQTASGIISGSLFNAGKESGLSDAMVMKLANIFAWDIDFILDIRQGDSFSLIYEKIYQEGEYLRDGDIIAASFTNQGQTYKALSYDDGNGFSYYNPEGRNMKKAFLRAPLNFSYISSNFNPKRFHPVQKRIKAHRGIDYAAPRGTPVYAAGNGTVTQSGYNKYNGNYVFIKHPSGITTKYLHFTKRKVKKGQKVRQGQTIGTVGSTGMVTGAHLHYEFVLNGVHRNPRTVKLPKATPLAKDKIKAYLTYATPILSQLDSISVNKVAIEKFIETKKES